MSNLPDRYVPTGDSASGGFGKVVFFHDTHLDRPVAIKSIKDVSEKHRIIDELNALMQLRSKHVVQVFDRVIGNDEAISIIEEFVDGDDLDVLFNKAKPKDYLKTLWQIASGIADIHSVGVIHRDIKHNNMKVDKEGIVKIFDFGLSRNTGKNAETIGFKGTFGYAAPELFKSGHVEFTQAVDTYAFGVIAIYLSGLTLPTELQNIPPQPILSLNLPFKLPKKLLLDFSNIIRRCLAFNPDDRPSMNEIRDKIASYLLKDKHQALAVHNNNPYVFNAEKQSASLNVPNIGSLIVKYDGLRFYVSKFDGEVFINNHSVVTNQEIPGSSVVTIGESHRGLSRKFITFDVSNPEVVL